MNFRASLALLLSLAACGSDPVTPGPDAGAADAAPIPVDAGVRALCPMLQAPQCTKAEDCGAATPAPADCTACRARYAKTCGFGACQTPDTPAVLVSVAADVTEVRGAMPRSFVLTAVDGETAGGLELTCADLTADTVSLSDACVTVMEARRWNLAELRPTGEIYTLFSSNFPTSKRALFMVEAFAEPLGNGMRLGVACAELPALAPQDANGRVNISAGTIHRL